MWAPGEEQGGKAKGSQMKPVLSEQYDANCLVSTTALKGQHYRKVSDRYPGTLLFL